MAASRQPGILSPQPARSRVVWARRALVGASVVALAWAVAIGLTGGLSVEVAGVRVSSHKVSNPLLFALASASAAVGLAAPRWNEIADDFWWYWRLVADAVVAIVSSIRRAPWTYLAVVLAAAAAWSQIGVWISGRPLWLDEEMIALNIRDRSFAELRGALWLGQGAPFGWLVAERAIGLLFGSGETALRFVPVAFSVATLTVACWAGRRWMTWPAAAAFVLLMGLGQWVSHYSLELKHYSADLFFGLLLPMLVVWTTEAADPKQRLQRAALWWAMAAIGQWLSMGALLVTPACAFGLSILLWRMDGRRAAAIVAGLGVLWLAVFGLHYMTSLQFTLHSDYLRGYWSGLGMPPASADLGGRVAWLAERGAQFEVKPGGTGLPVVFWIAALGGFVVAHERRLGWILAMIWLSAVVLAMARVVPLFERLSLWTIPALYAGVALAIDATVRSRREILASAGIARAALPVIAGVAGLLLCADVAVRGWESLRYGYPTASNHELNDRAAVGWLLAQRRPGDAFVTTHLALPAVWWYASAPIGSPALGSVFPDGGAILEASFHAEPSLECDDEILRRSVFPHERLLVYFGFRFDDVPKGLDDLLLQDLRRIGHVTRAQDFGGVSRAVIVEMVRSPAAIAAPDARRMRPATHGGCFHIQPARRW